MITEQAARQLGNEANGKAARQPGNEATRLQAKPTERQVAANRANAKKSTGPRTAAGKAKSAHNGVKHGLCTRDLILRRADSPEDAAEFEALLAELEEQYGAESAVEQALVESVAACLWRRRRALRFESAAMARQLDAARANEAMDAEQFARVDKSFAEVRASLAEAEEWTDRLKSPPPVEDVAGRQEFDGLVKRLARRFERRERGQALIDRLIVCVGDLVAANLGRMMTIRAEFGRLAGRMEKSQSGEVEVWLPPFEELGKLVRYENMLNRQLHRALMELRRIREDRVNVEL